MIEVPIEEGNRLVHKGDVLFRVDPTPYQLTVNSLKAQLVGAEGGAGQLREQLKSAVGNTAAIRARIDLARKRVAQNRELAATGAGNRFDLEQAEADLQDLEAQVTAAIASEAQVRAQLAAVVDGDIASIAKIKADLANAEWELEQTTVLSPCECYVINLQLRPGAFVAGMPFNPGDDARRGRRPGRGALLPERAAQGRAGQRGGVRAQDLPRAHHQGDGRFRDLGAGAGPDARKRHAADDRRACAAARPLSPSSSTSRTGTASCSWPRARRAARRSIPSNCMPIHIIRKVILRVGAYTDYLILKLH